MEAAAAQLDVRQKELMSMMLRVGIVAILASACVARAPHGSAIAPAAVSVTDNAMYRAVLDSVLPGEHAILLHPIRHIGRTPSDTVFAGFFVVRSATKASTQRLMWGPAVGLPEDASVRGELLARFYAIDMLEDSSRAAIAFQVVGCRTRCTSASLAWLSRDNRQAWQLDSLTVRRRHP